MLVQKTEMAMEDVKPVYGLGYHMEIPPKFA